MVEAKYKWNLKTKENADDIIKTMLENRSIKDREEFFNNDKFTMHNPYLLKDMEKAVNKIIDKKDDNIVIFGDYDVDGVTSTSLLYMFLRDNGFNVSYYIPDRIEEGYGMNERAIKILSDRGMNLIITVDNGITAISEIELANSLGIEVIITDHHECQEEVPAAYAVINPKQKDCNYPFKSLAGCGVAFKLVLALAEKLDLNFNITPYIEIAAIGTVADVVPLVEENRYIVKEGLKTLNNTTNLGVKNIVSINKIEEVNSTKIAFVIAPRINAVGRLGDAKKGVELLTTKDDEVATTISEFLDSENTKRRTIEKRILDEAIRDVEKREQLENVIVVWGNEWHHGVIGIVASRISEKYYRPTIVLSLEDGMLKGSARSIEGFSIFEALLKNNKYLTKFGGHEMAAGLSLKEENLDQFIKSVNEYAAAILTTEILTPKLDVEMKIAPDKINNKLIDEIKMFEPFGEGNREPIFLVSGKLNSKRNIGSEGKHLKLNVSNLDMIGFNQSKRAEAFKEGDEINVVGTLNHNEWNSVVKPQMMIKDFSGNKEDVFEKKYFESLYEKLRGKHLGINEIRSEKPILKEEYIGVNTIEGYSELTSILNEKNVEYKVFYNYAEQSDEVCVVVNPIIINNLVMFDRGFITEEIDVYETNFIYNSNMKEHILPKREDFIEVYKKLKKMEKIGKSSMNIEEFVVQFNINYFKIFLVLDIFLELGLINYEKKKNKVEFRTYEDKKINLDQSKLLENITEYFEVTENKIR